MLELSSSCELRKGRQVEGGALLISWKGVWNCRTKKWKKAPERVGERKKMKRKKKTKKNKKRMKKTKNERKKKKNERTNGVIFSSFMLQSCSDFSS